MQAKLFIILHINKLHSTGNYIRVYITIKITCLKGICLSKNSTNAYSIKEL
jgi:hypothetical protein